MVVCQTIAECRAERSHREKLALVPTMGALHAGHLSLVRAARKKGKSVAVSIFVNPTQFGPREDFNRYPRPIESDLAKCEEAGVDLVFQPSAEEMYRPDAPAISIDLPDLTNVLEGKHRPGHFKGVCQVVAKLFNILQPVAAVFGQKDFQQLRVISAMLEALDWPIEIVGVPTMRDQDGMAMSSRNQHLSDDERERALSISRALFLARDELRSGVRQANRLVATMQNVMLDPGKLGRVPVAIDYVAVVDPITLKPLDAIEGAAVLAIAATIGKTRLIDNVAFRSEELEPPMNADGRR